MINEIYMFVCVVVRLVLLPVHRPQVLFDVKPF